MARSTTPTERLRRDLLLARAQVAALTAERDEARKHAHNAGVMGEVAIDREQAALRRAEAAEAREAVLRDDAERMRAKHREVEAALLKQAEATQAAEAKAGTERTRAEKFKALCTAALCQVPGCEEKWHTCIGWTNPDTPNALCETHGHYESEWVRRATSEQRANIEADRRTRKPSCERCQGEGVADFGRTCPDCDGSGLDAARAAMGEK